MEIYAMFCFLLFCMEEPFSIMHFNNEHACKVYCDKIYFGSL